METSIGSFAQQYASPGLQYSTTYPYQVPDGQGALIAYYVPQQFATQGWLGNPIGQGIQLQGGGGSFGIPQLGLGGMGAQLGYNPFFGSPQAQAAQQVAQQAAQVAQQVAQQAAQQIAQQAAQVAQQAAQQVAYQAAQQVGQQAAQAGQQAACQAAHQIAGGCAGHQQMLGNVLGQQYGSQPWGWQGGFGNPWAQQGLHPYGLSGSALGYQQPQQLNAFAALGGQQPWLALQQQPVIQSGFPGAFGPQGGYVLLPAIRALNPFAGAPLGAQGQFGASPRFSFA